MDKEEKENKLQITKKISLNGKLFRLLFLVVCFGILAAIYMMLQSQDLSDIDGYKSSSTAPRNVQEVLSKAVEGNYSVTLTEADINHMLQSQINAKQGGMLSSDASIKRILVRLKKDIAEVIIMRELFGKEITVSMYLQIQQTEDKDGISTQIHLHGGDYNKSSPLPDIGGRFGKVKIPQGFLRSVVPDYVKIAEVLAPEIELGFEKMARFEIQDKRVLLDPRRPTRHEGGDGTTF